MTDQHLSPFKLKIRTFQLSKLHQTNGYYAVSYKIAHLNKIVIDQTKFVAVSQTADNVMWNDELSFQIVTTFSSLEWSLQYKGKEEDVSVTSVDSGKIVLNQLKLDFPYQKSIPCSARKFEAFESSLLDISFLLARNDSAIKVATSHRGSNLLQKKDSDEPSYGAIYTSFQQLMSEPYFTYLSHEWIRDCVEDTNYLVEAFVTKDRSRELSVLTNRNCSKLYNGSKYSLSASARSRESHYRYYPIEENSLQINLLDQNNPADDCSRYLILSFHNRFLLWTWYKWIKYAVKHWGSLNSPESVSLSTPDYNSVGEPPVWMVDENMTYISEGKIFCSDNRALTTGRIKIDLSEIFVLRCGKSVFDVKEMLSVIIACDAQLAKESIISFKVKDYFVPKKDSTKSISHSPSATAVSGSAPPVSHSFSSTISNVLQFGGAHPRKSTSSSSPSSSILSNTFSTIQSSAAFLYNDHGVEAKDCVWFKYQGMSGFSLYSSQEWIGNFFLENFFFRGLFRERSGKSTTDPSFGKFLDSSSKTAYPTSENGFFLMLHRGDTHVNIFGNSSESSARSSSVGVVCGKYLSLHRLYPLVAVDAAKIPTVASDYMQQTIHYREADVSVELNTRLGVSVILISSEELMFNESQRADLGLTGLIAKCKFVDSDGNSLTSSTASPSFPLAHKVDWKQHCFILDIDDGFSKAEFIRVEICIVYLATKQLVRGSLGAVFIPISFFEGKPARYTFPLFPFRRLTESSPSCSSGSLSFEIKRIEEPIVTSSIPALSLKISSHMCSVSTTSWMGEALIKGNIQYAENKNSGIGADFRFVERCLVHFGFDFVSIELTDEQTLDLFQRYFFRSTTDREIEYRLEAIRSHSNHLLASCKELDFEKKRVIIPYDRIVHHVAVTPSILSLQITVGRFFEAVTSGAKKTDLGQSGHVYQDCVVELFISNCPSDSLCDYCEDRRFFFAVRDQLNQVLFNTQQKQTRLPGDSQNTDNESLLRAVSLFKEMNYISTLMENKIQRMMTPAAFEHENDEVIVGRLSGRLCRMRLYTSLLFGINLSCQHEFVEEKLVEMIDEECRSVVSKDISTVESKVCSIPAAVFTALLNEPIDCLLNSLENRLIECLICGWNLERPRLVGCLEIIINRYFIEIVSLFSRYFEDSSAQLAVKGISNKIDLINCFINNNDKVSEILIRVLKPYGIQVTPSSPRLSLFYDISILISWYVGSLITEMRDHVDNVMKVWKDRSKDVTGESSYYSTTSSIPWVPQRIVRNFKSQEDSVIDNMEIFSSNIPEDVMALLNTYLDYGKIVLKNQETENNEFKKLVSQLNQRISISYIRALLYLVDLYYYEELLIQSDRLLTIVNEEGEETEIVIWVCSIVNDSYRVLENPFTEFLQANFDLDDAVGKDQNGHEVSFLCSKSKVVSEVQSSLDELRSSCLRVYTIGLQLIACYIFRSIFADDSLLHNDSLFNMWMAASTVAANNPSECEVSTKGGDQTIESSGKLKTSCSTSTNVPPQAQSLSSLDIFQTLTVDLLKFLDEVICHLEAKPLLLLLEYCLDKVIVVFFSILRKSRNYGLNFRRNPTLLARFKGNIDMVRSSFISYTTRTALKYLQDDELSHLGIKELVPNHFNLLDKCVILMQEEFSSNSFVVTLKHLAAQCSSDVKKSFSLYKVIVTCFALRGIHECFPTRLPFFTITASARNSFATPTVHNEASEKDGLHANHHSKIHFPVFHKMEVLVKRTLHHKKLSTDEVATDDGAGRPSSNDRLLPGLSMESSSDRVSSQNRSKENSQEKFAAEVADLKSQLSKDWVLSVLDEIKEYHQRFIKKIDKNEVTLLLSTTAFSPLSSVLEEQDLKVLQEMTFNDFTPECIVYGIVRKHLYTLRYLLLQTIRLYRNNMNIVKNTAVTLIDEEKDIDMEKNVENNDISINPAHAFVLWRKRIKKNVLSQRAYKSSGSRLFPNRKSPRLSTQPVSTTSQMVFSKLIISDIQILGNISFLRFIPSKLFLQFQFKDLVFTTKAKSQYFETSVTSQSSIGGCSFDETVEVPVFSVMQNGNSDQRDTMILSISLYHSGYLLTQRLAKVDLEFFGISPPNFRNKAIEFDEWNRAFSKKGTAGKADSSLPKLSLSIVTVE
jgi:hypothetical protein